MGSDDGAADEKPVHRVRTTRGFWLSKSAVTIAQWKQYRSDSGTPLPGDMPSPTDDYPMWGASWEDAQAYCGFYGLALPT